MSYGSVARNAMLLCFELANCLRQAALLVRCVVLLDDAARRYTIDDAEGLLKRLLCNVECCCSAHGLDCLAQLLAVSAVVNLALPRLANALDC